VGINNVAVIPAVESREILCSRVLFSSSLCIELLGGPRQVFYVVYDIPTIDNSFLVGLKKPVFVSDGWIYASVIEWNGSVRVCTQDRLMQGVDLVWYVYMKMIQMKEEKIDDMKEEKRRLTSESEENVVSIPRWHFRCKEEKVKEVE
jgi:hypothetical protein